MSTLFTRIVSGEIPCQRVYEDERHLAFLDISPVQPGHTLVIPKHETAYLFDLTPEAYADLFRVVRTVESKLRRATGCRRVILHVVGYEVPHVHVHLVPTNAMDEYPMPMRVEVSRAAMDALATRIRDA